MIKRFSLIIILILAVAVACTTEDATTVAPTDAPAQPTATTEPVETEVPATEQPVIQKITFERGVGYASSFWQVYFNQPTGEGNRALYKNGIDTALASAIDNVQRTLDISAFEMNNEVITEAILEAHNRGVQVRIVTDNEHGIEDDDSTLFELQEEGVPIVDDDRSGLMHNKFMIMDSTTVWTGSWNYTINGTYRNDNNALAIRSQKAVQAYQAEFDEMFTRKEFGKSSSTGNAAQFTIEGVEIQILFASEDDVMGAINNEIATAESAIRFMTFVFSEDSLRDAILERAAAGDITIEGIFENRNSTADWSELPPLLCAGFDVRQDTNPYVLHHKVFIIDDDTVITGSFNFSGNATNTNDENLVIIKSKDIANLYMEEYERLWGQSQVPVDVSCS